MLNVLIHSDSRYRVNRKIIRKAIIDTLAEFEASNFPAEVSVAVVGSRKMKALVDKFVGDGQRHQVLSFPFEEMSSRSFGEGQYSETAAGFVNLPDELLRLGEVVLCWPFVVEEASKDDMMVDDKVYELVCHAAGHLLGKHHE